MRKHRVIRILALSYPLISMKTLGSEEQAVYSESSASPVIALDFNDSRQPGGLADSRGVLLGDFDGDEDLDAVVANRDGIDRVWENDGLGNFAVS